MEIFYSRTWRAVFAPLFQFQCKCTSHVYHLYQGNIVKSVISQSSKIEISSKACVIIMNFSALEITLEIEQKSTFLDKKHEIVISYLPCEIYLDIKCLKYYLAEIKSKKNDFYFLAIIQNWFLSKCNFSLRKSNAIYWQLYKFAWQFESDEIWKCKSIKVKLKSERRKTRSIIHSQFNHVKSSAFP